MTMQGFSRFILRSILVVAVPITLLAGIYVAVDPFKALRRYDTYYIYDELSPLPNLAMVSVLNYEQQSQERRYNAFLFGSSIAQCIPPDEWRKYLPDDAEIYYLNSDQSTIGSICDRLQWLDARGDSIKYALIVLTPAELVDHEPYDPGLVAYPQVSSSTGWLRWHWTFAKGFYHRDFLLSWIGTQITGEPVEVRDVEAAVHNPYGYDPRTNYMPYTMVESRLAQGDTTVNAHPTWPADSAAIVSPPLIRERYCEELRDIARVLSAHHTDYRVIIPPSARHRQFAPADLELLRATFGPRLIDATASLDPLTRVDTLWYDPAHFRPPVARALLHLTYRDASHWGDAPGNVGAPLCSAVLPPGGSVEGYWARGLSSRRSPVSSTIER